MKPYADTNFFIALICGGPHGAAAEALQTAASIAMATPLPVTFLIRMEVTNAIQQQVFFARNAVQGIHASPEAAALEEFWFLDELRLGESMRTADVDLELLGQVFHTLAHRHTAKHGFRTYDIIHVASAIVLGCDAFWSFDDKAKRLAALEGLGTN